MRKTVQQWIFTPAIIIISSLIARAEIADTTFEVRLSKNGKIVNYEVEKLDFSVKPISALMLPEIEFTDGRVAHVVSARSEVVVPKILMDVVESSCGKNLKVSCWMSYPMFVFKFELVWKRHPEAKKIGTKLIWEKNKSAVFESIEVFSFGDKRKHSSLYDRAKLSDPEFSCKNWDWINFVDDKIHLLEWTTEFMTTNPETMQSENRTVSTVLNMKLEKMKNDRYRIGYPERSLPQDNGVFLLFTGDVVGWTVERPNKEICDVAIKPDSAAFISSVDNAKYGAMLPVKHESVLWKLFNDSRKYQISKFNNFFQNEEMKFLLLTGLIDLNKKIDQDGNITVQVQKLMKDVIQ